MATNTTENGVPQATHDKAVADARAAGKTEGMAEGAKAATDRFAAILNSDAAKTRTKAAVKMALNPKLAAVDADGIVEMLAELPEEKAEAPASGTEGGKPKAARNHFDGHACITPMRCIVISSAPKRNASAPVTVSVDSKARVWVEAATEVTHGDRWLAVEAPGPSLPADDATKMPAS